jgi:hypothetical protein
MARKSPGETPDDRRLRYQCLVDHRLCPTCKETVTRDGVYCDKHTRHHGPKGKRRKYRARWVESKLAEGMCGRCGRSPRKMNRKGRLGVHCVKCAAKQARKAKARWEGKHVRAKVTKCKVCRERGHNAASCPMLPPVRFESIDEYATARREWT